MIKTIKQIADELGVPKQKVYRFIQRNRISDVHHDAVVKHFVMQYDDAAQTLIKSHFQDETASRDVHHDAVGDVVFDAVDAVDDAVFDAVAQPDATMESVVLALREQLVEKDRQLQAKDDQIASLHRIMEQQNTLAMADKPTLYQLATRRSAAGKEPGPAKAAGGEAGENRKWYQFWK